jgi:hypothetical protein
MDVEEGMVDRRWVRERRKAGFVIFMMLLSLRYFGVVCTLYVLEFVLNECSWIRMIEAKKVG